ncbi:hypothetical protein A3H89_01140 [Candidatus Amesbacteria bacterium RIFCSPLOWO2_02_FULL_48_11]|uniref:Glycosyl transferase family 1 domain-containing protein n=5 Tax=Candidatus Amesiibacteriota TaxID=1752730 RepID=A0A1F4Z8N1_9BACT|nr:MAG: Glycosyl transferase group 1 [Candidatus Amesbacteria bacterium GW2011_GWA2_47_11]KKU90640.1 MAG: Glycosyl transferase group 1 [Candidatus Amesbacteria bacterium GW2011_GWC1_48_10]KKW00297.1 MAG: Glycosyl transferase group 1 [Candidatus Amesbacteria bacterium GW2011_GWA1_48_9]OGC89943.1 MAG: hypothetical protein A2V48_02540 [Candidatus Amesbacteria bacterium RBG_19FT_COMBO_48_16]OGC95571.1 MAG: hypothetical protein A3C34_00385 [Candidatus Amesbacteria bacterium RIFCSPHIGHO2_02_FULL_48_2
MKAAIYNPYWDTLGGGERYTAAFVKLLLYKGWQVDIHWPENISAKIYNRFGIDISTVKFVSANPYPLSTIHYSLLFWLSDGSLPTSWAKKTVIHFQFPFKRVSGRRLPNLIKSRFYTFVANSQFTKEVIDQEFRVNCRVIYPPIDTAKFSAVKKTDTIIYVGRFSQLTQLKGYSLLIDVFKRISPHLPSWQLILAGGTTVGTAPGHLNQLRSRIRGLPVKIITNPEFGQLAELYSQAKIFWSASGFSADEKTDPTRTEHFGITVVESMAAGCVPVITNRGGHKEIVDHNRNGYLWNTPKQLADYTLQIIKQPGKLENLSQAAVQKSKIFDVSRFNHEFSRLLNL